MKRQTEEIYERHMLFFRPAVEDSFRNALCNDFVDTYVKGHPQKIRVQARAMKPTATQGKWFVARRIKDGDKYGRIKVGTESQYAFNPIHEKLESIGVKQGQKFWFKITAI